MIDFVGKVGLPTALVFIAVVFVLFGVWPFYRDKVWPAQRLRWEQESGMLGAIRDAVTEQKVISGQLATSIISVNERLTTLEQGMVKLVDRTEK